MPITGNVDGVKVGIDVLQGVRFGLSNPSGLNEDLGAECNVVYVLAVMVPHHRCILLDRRLLDLLGNGSLRRLEFPFTSGC